MNVSQYAKANDMTKEAVMEKFGLNHHLQTIPEEAVVEVPVVETEQVVKVEQVAEKPKGNPKVENKKQEPTQVVFYWKDGRNINFMITGPIVGGVQQAGEFYKSEQSVLRLDSVKDQAAIAKLRAMAGHEKNGGIEFGEVDGSALVSGGEGHLIDKLMAMSVPTLVAMLGGTFSDTLKSKGTLIAEVLKIK